MSTSTRSGPPLVALTVTLTVRQLHAVLRAANGKRQSLPAALGNHLLRHSRSGRPITLNLSPV